MRSTDRKPDPGPAGPATAIARREITDARTMRAIAHPIRVALLEMLAIEPSLTATEAVSVSTVQQDPETAVAAGALARLYRNRQFERLQQYLETSSSYPMDWQEAATSTASRMWMTATELQVFAEELTTLLIEKFRERRDDPAARPEGALPVEILMHSFPTRPPTEEDPS